MNINDLQRVLVSFADSLNDVEIKKGEITAIIRNEAISAQVKQIDGNLFIVENDIEYKAIDWIALRLANLEQLAYRMREYVPKVENFIDPKGHVLNDINVDPSEEISQISSVTTELIRQLSNTIPGTTQVTYLTSDAGEGKTSLINDIARRIAQEYLEKKRNWLLIPIPLGGRPFLRFDDIVIASIVNKLRFQYFYYESFIELVKLGIIVPAFDGFEEMFMEGSPGEALSATGQLMNKLDSGGKILIAARKAYFDYKDFSTQAKLFDTIGQNSVSFMKIGINRWDRDQFMSYCVRRGVSQADEIYNAISTKLNSDTHPLLTRPVLVKQLIDTINTPDDLNKFSSFFDSTSNYFPRFVEAIIVREAETKWIDKSGEHSQPLLTVEEHYDLLSFIAEEMWLNSTDILQSNILDFIAELYCESKMKSPKVLAQVKERIKQHALIIKSEFGVNNYQFDHEEFKEFFLGIAIANYIKEKKTHDVKNMFRKGSLYKQTIEAILSRCKEENTAQLVNFLLNVQKGEGRVSYIRENNGGIIIGLLNNFHPEQINIESCIIPENSLSDIRLTNIVFKECNFQSTSITNTDISNCFFDSCTFDGITYDDSSCCFEKVIFKDCQFGYLQNEELDMTYYNPFDIIKELKRMNIQMLDPNIEEGQVIQEREIDKDLQMTEKALRKFIRTTFINDNIFKVRLGNNADRFFKDVLPLLLDNNIIKKVDYLGSGTQSRYRLNIPFNMINDAFANCDGSLNDFILQIKERMHV